MSRYKELIESISEQNTNGGISFEKWTTLLLTDMAISLAVIADALVERDIPSVEPKTPSNGSITSMNPENTHDRTMGDSISRQDAIDAIFSEPLYESGMKKRDADAVVPAIYEKIKSLPSAEQEMIRCKDCKHWIPYDWMFSEVWQNKNMEDYPEDEIGCDCCDMNMRADDYCSRAERRQ